MMPPVAQALVLPTEAGPGAESDNLNNPHTDPNRQQRRALQSVMAKADRKLSAIEQRVIHALGFDPHPIEVADLIGAHQSEGLIANPDQDALRKLTAELRSGAGHAAAAYAVLLAALKRGPFVDRALYLLEQLYGPKDVIELRAVFPGGRAQAYHGRVGCERDQMAQFIQQHMGVANLYFGINPRQAGLTGFERASKAADVACRSLVVLDLDNKDAPENDPDWMCTRSKLQEHDPLMEVFSGNGFHVWFSIQPLESEALSNSVAPLAQAMSALGADNMADLPRIIRLPWSINIPTKAKRNRGDKLASARVLSGPNPNAMRHDNEHLARRFEDVARVLGLSGKKSQTVSGTGSKNDKPWELLRAPTLTLLQTLLQLLPNNDHVSRGDQVTVAHAVWGACKGADFEPDGRLAFLEWSQRFWGYDPEHDLKLWESIGHSGIGFSQLVRMLRVANPAGFAQMSELLKPVPALEAMQAFAGVPIDPAQAHMIADVGAEIDQTASAAQVGLAVTQDGKKGEPPHARAMQILVHAGAEFFRDQNGRIYVKLAGQPRDLGSGDGLLHVCGWLTERGINLTGTARTQFKEAAEARAFIENPREMHYRQADGLDPAKPEAFLNMMDGNGMGIRVDATRWRKAPVSTFPHEMADRSKARPLADPVRANDGVMFMDRFAGHVSLAPVQNTADALDAGVQQRAIWICFLLAQFYRPGMVPHLLFAGHQGAGKTTTARRAKSLTDPDSADVVASLPPDETAIYAIAGQQTCLIVDNMSAIRAEHSDVFCALASGTAFQKRQLYKDGDRVVFTAKTSVLMTTINEELVKREDLMDRTLVMTLPRLDPAKRRTEAEMNEAWDRELPFLLADLLDLLSAAFAKLPVVRSASSKRLLPTLPRFADAALLAEAACQIMGWPPGLCLKALNATRCAASADQLENNPVAYRVKELVQQGGGTWSGTTVELHAALRFLEGPDWGRLNGSVQGVTNALVRAEEPLRQVWGIEVKRTRTRAQRTITITGHTTSRAEDA